jgi:UDP-N-acetylglucosamine 3-dehydrogenase
MSASNQSPIGNSQSPVVAAILGAGNMGRRLASSFQSVPGVSIKYVYSRTLSRAQEVARLCAAEPLDKAEKAFADDQVDAVVICLPTFTRSETLKSAVESGKHIFCEKPLALNQAMSEEIRRLLSGYRQVTMVGQVVRFFWEYGCLREKVLAGDIGEVGVVRLSRCVGYPGAASWFADPEKSGGVILDLLIHDLDFLRWTFGEVKQVYAKGLTFNQRGKLDYALLNLQLESGALAHVEGSWAHPVGSFRQSVEICGAQGMLSYDSLSCANFKVVSTAETESAPSSRISLPEADPSSDPYFTEVSHFVDCIRSHRQPDVSWEDSLRSCQLAFLAIESVRQGIPLRLGT